MRLLSEMKKQESTAAAVVVRVDEHLTLHPPITENERHSSKSKNFNVAIVFVCIYIVLLGIISYWICIATFHRFYHTHNSNPFITTTQPPIEFESTVKPLETSTTEDTPSQSTQASGKTDAGSNGSSDPSMMTTVIGHSSTSETEKTETVGDTPISSTASTGTTQITSVWTSVEEDGESNSDVTEGSSSTTVISGSPTTTRRSLNPVNDNPISFINEKFQPLPKYTIKLCASTSIHFAVLNITYQNNTWKGRGAKSQTAKQEAAYEAMKELFPDDLDEVIHTELDNDEVICSDDS